MILEQRQLEQARKLQLEASLRQQAEQAQKASLLITQQQDIEHKQVYRHNLGMSMWVNTLQSFSCTKSWNFLNSFNVKKVFLGLIV